MMKEIIWDSFYLKVSEIESRTRWSGAGWNGGNIRTDNWRKVTICYFVGRIVKLWIPHFQTNLQFYWYILPLLRDSGIKGTF
jgi:hypothetical protein